MRVFLVKLYVGDRCVFMVSDAYEATLVLADDHGCNELYPAKAVACNIGLALEVVPETVEAPQSLTEPEEWNYDDVGAWLTDSMIAGKLKSEPLQD
jgi:hypothetical protein